LRPILLIMALVMLLPPNSSINIGGKHD